MRPVERPFFFAVAVVAAIALVIIVMWGRDFVLSPSAVPPATGLHDLAEASELRAQPTGTSRRVAKSEAERASAEEESARASREEVASKDVEEMDGIAVDDRGSIEGIVKSADGEPLGGRTVRIRRTFQGRAISRVVRSAQDGTFRLGNVLAGQWDVFLLYNGPFLPHAVVQTGVVDVPKDAVARCEITERGERKVRGVVRITDEPDSAVQVYLVNMQGTVVAETIASWGDPLDEVHHASVSDDYWVPGAFAFSGLAEGDYLLKFALAWGVEGPICIEREVYLYEEDVTMPPIEGRREQLRAMVRSR